MKVKIKDKIYDGAEEPVMIILSKEDKKNIANMPDYATKYLSYPDTMTGKEAKEFMKI